MGTTVSWRPSIAASRDIEAHLLDLDRRPAHLAGMTTAPDRKRRPVGTSAGGQFTTEARTETPVSLSTGAPVCELCASPAVTQAQAHTPRGKVGEPRYACGQHRYTPTFSTFGGGWYETSPMPPERIERPTWGGRRDGEVGPLPLTQLVTTAEAMREVLVSGRVSDTPQAPVLVRAREDDPTRWEIADGHHRVAQAIREGRTEVLVEFDTVFDDEPYGGELYDFTH